MTTTVSEAVHRTVPGAYDRVFYTGIALAMALTVFAGFAPTYYLRLVSGDPVTISGSAVNPTVHAHGILFSAWVLLFIVQTSLIAARRVSVHRRLGLASILLAAGMIVAGLRTATDAAARGVAPAGLDPITFLVVPFFDLVLFAGFITTALLKRRDRESHKRLMLLAYVSIIPAAMARLPGVLPHGPFAFTGLALVFVALGIIYDRVSRGRIHPWYLWGGALIALSTPLRLLLAGTAAWRAFADIIVR